MAYVRLQDVANIFHLKVELWSGSVCFFWKEPFRKSRALYVIKERPDMGKIKRGEKNDWESYLNISSLLNSSPFVVYM